MLKRLTLRELEVLASLGLTGLLTFYLTSIASHEAFCFKRSLIFRIDFYERTSDSEAECLSLALEAATVEVNFDIVFLSNTKFIQWLLNDELKDRRREILSDVTLVDSDRAVTFAYENASYCSFTSSECVYYFDCLIFKSVVQIIKFLNKAPVNTPDTDSTLSEIVTVSSLSQPDSKLEPKVANGIIFPSSS